MMLDDDTYKVDDFCLALIPDFQSLNAAYQTHGVPVFALTDHQMGYGGTVLEQYQQTRRRFHDLFSEFANRVIAMTRDD
jgi:hypothetical protein